MAMLIGKELSLMPADIPALAEKTAISVGKSFKRASQTTSEIDADKTLAVKNSFMSSPT